MALDVTPVNRSLDRKLKFLGFEIPDLLLILVLLSVLNFVFSGARYSIALSWGPAALLAILIHFGKRGRPDGYILHLTRFKARQKYLSAFKEATSLPKIKRNSK